MPRNFQASLVACFGRPVAENPTGVMQEAAFAKAGLDWRYLTVEVAPEGLAAAVNGARAMGFRGFNCTIPHKVAVIPLLDRLTDAARITGAVNTVWRDGENWVGDNTDGKGFLQGVRQDAGRDPAGAKAVVLGAGGAARAIATELLLAGAETVTVVNRGVERGQQMVDELRSRTGKDIRFVPLAGAYAVPGWADLFVNATRCGLFPDVEAMPPADLTTASPHCLVCDAVFNPPETRLLARARELGLPVLDGLSMLVYQGVAGFEIWTGVKPDVEAMRQALRTALEV